MDMQSKRGLGQWVKYKTSTMERKEILKSEDVLLNVKKRLHYVPLCVLVNS